MAHLKIPAALDTITTEWLTKALHSTGMITNATVKSFDINMLGEGQGFTGQIGRFQLDYDIEEEDAPRSLVAKFPAINPKVRATLNRFRIYEREIRFYQEIAEEIELRTPHFYYSDLDIETGESILLLEDLTHARVGNNVAGCSPAEAELAIRDLAKFHATWWESPQLEEIRWMPAFDDDAESLQELYQQLWEPFTEKFKDFLSDEFLELGFRFGKNVVNIGKQLSQPPQTIVHGDYRLDNLLFSSPESGTMLTVIDWQVAQRGRGVSDVAYFLGGSLPSEQRRDIDMSLLRTYHSLLVENGVRGYDFDQCLHDFRLSILQGQLRLVIALALLDFTSERGQALADIVLQRRFVIVDDYKIGELMPE